MAIRLAIKIGSQKGVSGLKEGMVVCTLRPGDLISNHMRLVYAIVDVPDTWARIVAESLQPHGNPFIIDKPTGRKTTKPDTTFRARKRFFDLETLAKKLGNPSLVARWRGPEPVPIQRGPDLGTILMRDATAYEFPDVPDANAVSSGSFTVGTAGDYATWSAAAADIAATLTGALTFTQISNVTETAVASFLGSVALAGNTVTLTSDTPPDGDPTAGHLTIINHALGTAAFDVIPDSGAGTVIVRDLRFRADVSATSNYVIQGFPASSSAITLKMRDIIIDGNGNRRGLLADGNANATVEIWNIVASDAASFGVNTGTGAGTITIENCASDNSTGTGISVNDAATRTVKNCVSIGSTTADFSPSIPTNAVMDHNASEDTTASGTGSITSIVPATTFKSVSNANAEYLKLENGSALGTGGVTPGITDNDFGNRTNLRPGSDSSTSIGADELGIAIFGETVGTAVVTEVGLTFGALIGAAGNTNLTIGVAVLDGFVAASIFQPIIAPAVLLGGPVAAVSWDDADTVVLGTAALLGNFNINWFQPTVIGTAVLPDPFLTSLTVTGVAIGDAILFGGLPVDAIGAFTPEDRARLLGFRPSVPLLIHVTDALLPADVTAGNVPLDGHFLVSVNFIPVGGDPFTDNGATPGAIGTRAIVSTGGEVLTFRPPLPNEIVWNIEIDANDVRTEKGFLRFSEDSPATWKPYQTMPERWLNGQRVFDALDPDKVYDFYAKLVGATFSEWTLDNISLLDLIDPKTCPEDFLDLLAKQFDLTLVFADAVAVKRQRIKNAIATFKLKGLPSAVELKLRTLNFKGFANEIWVNPTDVDNWEAVADAPAAIQADIAARGLTDLIDPDSGTKGQDFFELPHGYRNDEPMVHFPSSRVTLHINNADGSPIDITLPAEDLDALKRDVSNELLGDVLPAHVDIRFFATDIEVGDAQDSVEIEDTMVLTEV